MVFTEDFKIINGNSSHQLSVDGEFNVQNILERRFEMTSNQINYWNYVENSRHNRAVEIETHRSNVTNERETNRSNLARESETSRHNLADEQIRTRANEITSEYNNRYLSELSRHNQATEGLEQQRIYSGYEGYAASERNAQRAASAQYAGVNLGYAQLAETQRLNNLVTSETRRTNRANESIRNKQASAQMSQADSSQTNAATNRLNALTAQSTYELEKEKWNSIGAESARASVDKMTSETARNYAQAERAEVQNQTDKNRLILDAFKTGAETAIQGIDTARKFIPFLGGM